jgi:hypothetical protein
LLWHRLVRIARTDDGRHGLGGDAGRLGHRLGSATRRVVVAHQQKAGVLINGCGSRELCGDSVLSENR